MATRAELIQRRQRADEARQRLKSGELSQSQPTQLINPRTEALKAYTSASKGTPMAELQQNFGDITPMNLIGSAQYRGQQIQQERLSQQPATEYERRSQDIEQSSAPAPIKAYAKGMNWLTYGNPVGRFVSRAGSMPDNIMSGGQPATIRPELGPVANKTADILGAGLLLAAPTGAPVGGGALTAPYRAIDDLAAATPRLQRAETAIANTLANRFKPQTAQAIAREGVREGLAGTIQGPALALTAGQPDTGELAGQAALGALGGAALAGAGAGLVTAAKGALANRQVGNALMEGIRNTDLPTVPGRGLATEAATSPGQQVDAYFNELLQTSGPTTARVASGASLDRILTDIKPVVTERMTPPLESPRELARWIQANLGSDIPLNEIRQMDYTQMSSLANDIRNNMSLEQVANQVARDMGYDLQRALSGPRRISPNALQQGRETQRMRGVVGLDPLVREPNLLTQGQRFQPTPRSASPLPEIDPNAAPILRPGQFDPQNGLGITPFSRTNPYDSLKTDTRSQLVSRQLKEPKGLTVNTDRIYTALVDDLHPLNRQDKILEDIMGESIPASQRIHDLGLASRGADMISKRIITDGLVDSAGKVVTEANGQAVGSLKDILAPLRPLMRRNKDIYVDFEDYLLNKHAPARYERGEKVFRDDLLWSPEYGAQKVAEYEQMFPQFREMSDRLYTFQRELGQKWLVDTGVIPQDILDAWVQQNPFFVPNKRYFSQLEKTGKMVGGGKKKGYGNQSNPVKGYQEGGSQRSIISPIEAIIENVDAYVKTAKRNQVMQQYVRNIEQNPKAFEPWATVVKQPEKVDDISKIVMDEGGLDELLFRFSADFDKAMQRTQLDKDNIVRALVDGQPVHVQIKDKDLLGALTALGPEQSGYLLGAVGKLTNTMKLLTTGSNPVFTLTRNLLRDIPQAYIASKTSNNPISFAADLFGAAVDIARNKGSYKDFLNVGGGHASAIAADRNLLAQSKRRVLPQSGARSGIARGIDAYENFLNTVEIAPRLAEFKRVQQQGGDLQAALKEAQDLTVNFKRRGKLSGEVDKVFPYFNAAIQGMDKTLRTYRDDPVKALVKTALAITFPTLALYAVNHDDPNYQQLSNRTKDAFLLIPRGDGTFIKIAKPQEQGTIFSDIPERLMRLLAEEDPAAFRDFADRLRTTLLPPGIQGAVKGGGLTDSLLGVVGDTILGPVADIAANETFSGAPIVPGNLERLSPGLQADAKTTNIARWIGEQTLGTPFEQSPKELDYLVRQYSGFLGQFGQPLLSPGGDVGYALSQQMTADPVFSNDLSTEFYNYKDKLDQAYADRALRDLPEWYSDPLRKRLNKISTNMSAVRKEIREVQGDEDISNADKRAKLRELQGRINRMAEMGNGLARDQIPY
ncbi:LPD38 domain-containing protein [Paenibacillus senegalimassiliensis]|uniref:LPD38 domain-containing protein n=1 Tax=Paenibacillus senegalimassiliensis TaxID=1737426 RepID=UPI00073EF13B|nr:LPD38 domain-containing protein [Paenibacillus senegalimassiliensis]